MIDDQTVRYMATLSEGGLVGEPCDEWEVSDLEQHFQVKLPSAFKAFLMLAGKWFDPFVGSQYILERDGFYDAIELQQAAQRMLQRDGNKLLRDAFVFFVHQGVALRFFLLNDGDDPPVFEYVEHDPPAKQVATRLSEFLLSEVRGLQELRSRRLSDD